MPPASRAEIRTTRQRPKTKRRAEQNRAAQRRYREKLKLRQVQLEEFARRRGYNPDREQKPRGVEPNWSELSSELSPEPTFEPAIAEQQINCPILTGRVGFYPNGPRGEFAIGENGTVSPSLSLARLSKLQYPDFMERSPAQLITLLEDGGGPHDFALDKDKILAEYDLRALNTTNHLLSSNKRVLLEHLFHVLGLDDRESNSDLVRLAFKQGLNLRQLLNKGITVILDGDHDLNKFVQSSTTLANPYANSLRFKRFATLDAFMSNALAIGYYIPDLYNLKKPSPFWRPEVKSVSDIQGPLAAYYQRLPPHLRPVSLQIKWPHKPYIDLLPFPALRMRILAAVTQEPPLIDEYELKYDIFHEGIICWTSSRRGTGQPWDMRSWDIAEWFKRKWTPKLFDDLELAAIGWVR